jgi:hypothetical protein
MSELFKIRDDLLVRAFDCLEGEGHTPDVDGCPCCGLMWEIEQTLGRQLTDIRPDNGANVVGLQPVGSDALH